MNRKDVLNKSLVTFWFPCFIWIFLKLKKKIQFLVVSCWNPTVDLNSYFHCFNGRYNHNRWVKKKRRGKLWRERERKKKRKLKKERVREGERERKRERETILLSLLLLIIISFFFFLNCRCVGNRFPEHLAVVITITLAKRCKQLFLLL